MKKVIDTGKIKQDISGCGLSKKNTHPCFIIIVTQNPRIEGFTNQRNVLPKKFISIYSNWISFIKINELRIITKDISKK